nr:hypothetical protein [uncultured Pseudomonas sp.]
MTQNNKSNKDTEKSRDKLETLHLSSQITLNFISVIAAIVIGIWAWWSTYTVKREGEIAELTLQDLKQKTQLAPHIGTKIQTKIHPSNNTETTLEVAVTLTNQGTDFARLNLEKRALSITKVDFRSGAPDFNHTRNLGDTRYKGETEIVFPYIDIGPSETYELNYIFQIEEPGLYLVRFLSRMKSDHLLIHKARTATPELIDFSTGADQYITIP